LKRPNGCGGDQNASGEVAVNGVSVAAVVVAVEVVVAVAVEHGGGDVVAVAEPAVAVPFAAGSVRYIQYGCYCYC
jgi:hypothetical protein